MNVHVTTATQYLHYCDVCGEERGPGSYSPDVAELWAQMHRDFHVRQLCRRLMELFR